MLFLLSLLLSFSVTGKTPGRCYFMPQKYGKYFNYQNFYLLFCICGKKIFPIRRNVVPGTIKTISFVYLSEPQPRRQPPFPNAPTSPTFPGLGSFGNVVGCAASALPFPPTLLPLFFRDFRFAGLCRRLPYFYPFKQNNRNTGLKTNGRASGRANSPKPNGVCFVKCTVQSALS